MTDHAITLLALLWSGAASASGPERAADVQVPATRVAGDGPAAVEAPEDPELGGLRADAPAVERDADGLFAWIEAMQGEVPTADAVEGFKESVDAELSQMALVEHFGTAVVPLEFYKDPAEALRVDPLRLDELDPSEFDIPITVNAAVEKWMHYFTGRGRKYYARWLDRASRYRPLMLAELEREGLPRDLVYLSMIESGYNAHAYSHAGAAGLWQFIPSTGRLYDLRVDWWIDDRRDPERSTKAAVRYLSDLHKMFDGDWYLAFAAYNGGPGRVRRAMRQADSSDFWTLADGPYLHSETDNYVPKLLAAAIIGKHPERYGFDAIDPEPELTFDTVKVDGSVELEVLAKVAGISLSEFQKLNPALRRWATPPEGHEVRVPAGSRETFAAALAEIPASERLAFVRHEVARGETLSVIASRYGVTATDVARANRLANVDRIYVGMSLVIPVPGSRGAATAAAARVPAPAPVERAPRPATHTVARGDTLSGIAAKYGVTMADLEKWNRVDRDRILVGQELTLGPAGAREVTYEVARGDTLSGIAARFGVSSSDLQRKNGIRNPSHIRVGQTLTIPLPEQQWETYTVRRGDSLGLIAQRNDCSVEDLRTWNQLSSSVIHPGQELRIKR